MNFQQRVKAFFSSDQPLSNSLGSVMRNYSKQATFRPQEQLRGITYKAVDKIGQSVSVYEPNVENKAGDTVVNHPLMVLFNKPNSKQTATDFLYLWAMLYEIYGETFWYIPRGEFSNKVKEIHLLNPPQVELSVHGGELVGYVLHKADGTQVPLLPEEVIHDKRPNPFNEWRGMSVMERAATYIDTEITTSTFTLNYMRNNASPSGIVSLPNMDKSTFNQFAAQWREGYEGPENAGKTAFIRGGEATFKAVGATLKDVDQKVTREMSKSDVLMMFEVPKELLGMTDGGALGRSTVEAFSYIFSKEKIEPMMKRLDRIYEKVLELGSWGGNATDVDHESPIPEDKEHQLAVQTKGTNVWITVNEARAMDGLPPLPNGDDLQIGNVAPQDNTSGKSIKRVVLKKAETKVEVEKKLNKDQEKFRKKLVETTDIYSVKLKRSIAKFMSSQEFTVISNINASKKAYEEWLPSVKESSQDMAEIMSPIILDLMEAQIVDVANFISGELLVISPEMRRSVEAHILQLAGVYNSDTIKALEKTITEGQTAGESLAKIKSRVEQVYSDSKGYRAERIARTESLRASNSTAEEVYKQNGYNQVQWFINPGACEFCQSYANQTKEIGSTFTNIGDVVTGTDGGQMKIEYTNIDTPPLHPNCTCSLVPGE